MNIKQIAALAKQLGLVHGKGTYNGQKFWVRPGSSAIITHERVLELAGYASSPHKKTARPSRRPNDERAIP